MPSLPRRARPAIESIRHADKTERDAFYSGARWRALRLRKLMRDPLCEMCHRLGRVTLAEVVHHVIDRLKAPHLAYTWSNLESACNACHTRHHKTKG
jgi:5-methylcytosine-specific restriction protein A